MRFLGRFAVLIILLLSAQPNVSAKGWALLVGINDYANPLIRDLRGCETDVQLMADVLVERFGFANEDMKILRSREATRDAIIAAFKTWLIEKPKPDDVVVFYFSGHGAQVVDEDGDEADGWDELLCPADLRPTVDRSQYANPILDDQLGELLRQIPTHNVTVILDSCHSGTGTKSLVSAELSFPKAIPRDLILTPRKPPARPITQRDTVSVEQTDENHVLISGSAAEQVSLDAMWDSPAGIFYAGVLTKNLVEALRKATADTHYTDLMGSVKQSVRQRSHQTPQLEGDTDRPLFSTRQSDGTVSPVVVDVPSKPFFRVTQVEGGTITVNAGSILGVTAGSVYDIFSPTEASFTGDPLARTRITSVDLNYATGGLFDARFTIQPMCRAVESSHAHRLDKLLLRLQFEGDPAQRSQFEDTLSEIPDLMLVESGGYADLVLEIERKETGFSARMTLGDGTALGETTGAGVGTLISAFRGQLENAFIKKWLTNLKNPNPPFKIKVWMDKGNNPVYQVGEVASFGFRSEQDCYLTLFNVDTQGHVTVLFPNSYHLNNRILAGVTYEIPSKDMGFRIRAQGPPGRELLKAVAMTEPAELPELDLSNLSQKTNPFLGFDGAAGVRSLTRGLMRAFVVEKKEEPVEQVQSTSVSHLDTSKFVTSELFAEIRE